MNITIEKENSQNLALFKEILKKDESSMINEALELYFLEQQQKLLEKNADDDNAQTNLSFDEFWDDVEI